MANALANAAHANGKSVVVHAAKYVALRKGLECKGDIITHAPPGKPVDAEMVQQMIASNLCSVPTLIMASEASKRSLVSAALSLLIKPALFMAIVRAQRSVVGKQKYQNAKESVTAMYQGGVSILADSQCHEEDNSFFDVKHGKSLHQELERLADAGLSTVDALRAATVLPAEQFNLFGRGMIAEGERADLVLLREDPIQGIRATRSIERAWCGGRS